MKELLEDRCIRKSLFDSSMSNDTALWAIQRLVQGIDIIDDLMNPSVECQREKLKQELRYIIADIRCALGHKV